MAINQGDELWRPSPEQVRATRLADYMQWLATQHGRKIDDYQSLWQWSVDDLDGFWSSIWQFFDIQADGDATQVLNERSMPGAQWFPNTRLNYAEHVFRNATASRPALVSRYENQPLRQTSWAQLEQTTGALAAQLRAMGVVAGDRVVSYMPNLPETVIAFLA